MKVFNVALLLLALVLAANAVSVRKTLAPGATGGEHDEDDATGAEAMPEDTPPKVLGGNSPEMKAHLAAGRVAAKKAVEEQRAKIKSNLEKTLTDAIAKTEKYAAEQKSACSAEAKLTVEWDKESDPEAAKAERAGRNAAKQQLADAIAKRESVLKKFLVKLHAGRSDLDQSIQRTNDIFFGIYDSNVAVQLNAKNAMHLTAGLAAGEMTPFKPIILPSSKLEPLDTAKWAVDHHAKFGGKARPEPSKAAAKAEEEGKVALMELAAHVQGTVASCSIDECKKAYNAAYELYDFVFKLDCANYKIYDVDTRVPLMTYRNGLHKLITDREAKLAALAKQRKALEDGLKNEEPKLTLAMLYGYIGQHKTIQINACEHMPKNTAKTLEKLRAILADARANKLVCNLESGSGSIPGDSESGDDKATGAAATNVAATGAASGTESASTDKSASDKKEEADKSSVNAPEDKPPQKNDDSASGSASSPLENTFDGAVSGSKSGSGSNNEEADPLASPATKDEVKSATSKAESVPANAPPEQKKDAGSSEPVETKASTRGSF